MPHPTPTKTGCAPWCDDHHGGTDDALCRTRIQGIPYGSTLMTYSADEGTLIWLLNTRDELTPDQAEDLARALLAQVAKARTGTAVAA